MRARSLGPVVASLLAALLTGVLAASLTGAPATALTTDQMYRVPAGKTIVVRGHGFGHGHGMSQYGAYGAARDGLSHKQILDFYYPRTRLASVHGKVRVLITADTTRDLMVSATPGLTLRDRGDGTTYELPDRARVKRWRLNVDHGRTVIGYRTKHWHRYRPGGKDALVGDGELSANGPMRLWTPSGPHRYRGVLRSDSPANGSADRDTVNVLSMDNYVKGVIPAEMPTSWPAEAVQAQAVAARTYATWSRGQNRHRYYQICDTTACQVYGGFDAEDARGNRAVQKTRREILTFRGDPAFTQFSSSSGGWTSAGSVPYLPAQKDPYDGHGANPVHTWSVSVDARRLEKAHPAIGKLRRIRVVRRDGNGQWRGRVVEMVLDGSRADRTISGDSFRWMFGLRSNWFTLKNRVG